MEVDVPIDALQNYNADRGEKYGSALRRSRISAQKGSHGLAGGFNTTHVSRAPYDPDDANTVDLSSVPRHGNAHDHGSPTLATQTLGGKIKKPTANDPIYMLGCIVGGAVHLTRLDALVQLAPQLHHLDAADEIQRAKAFGERRQAGDGSSKPVASRAVNMRIKGVDMDPEQDKKDKNDALLIDIQAEPWRKYTWVDHDDVESASAYDRYLRMHFEDDTAQLKASMANAEWLDAMSAPRVDPSGGKNGAMGLLAKVKGREREKLRKRRSEKKRKELEAKESAPSDAQETAPDAAEDEDSGSETGSDETDEDTAGERDQEDHDVQMIDPPPTQPGSKRKGKAPVRETDTAKSDAPKKPRGRPKKVAIQDAVVID